MRAIIDFVLMILRALGSVLGARKAVAAPIKRVGGVDVLKRGDKGPAVIHVQQRLRAHGFPVTVDGDFGRQTTTAVRAFQVKHALEVDGEVGPMTLATLNEEPKRPAPEKPEAPKPAPSGKGPKWYQWTRKLIGKRETDKSLVSLLVPTWAKLGLPGYKKLAGSAYAWCGVITAAALIATGHSYQKNGAGARNWAKYGTEINWQRDGIPRGAIVHINHAQNCSSGEGNHVAQSDGDCSPADLKSGAINLLGGNQSDSVNVTAFPVKEICEVRWPPEEPLPKLPIATSDGCKGKSSGGSTR